MLKLECYEPNEPNHNRTQSYCFAFFINIFLGIDSINKWLIDSIPIDQLKLNSSCDEIVTNIICINYNLVLEYIDC